MNYNPHPPTHFIEGSVVVELICCYRLHATLPWKIGVRPKATSSSLPCCWYSSSGSTPGVGGIESYVDMEDYIHLHRWMYVYLYHFMPIPNFIILLFIGLICMPTLTYPSHFATVESSRASGVRPQTIWINYIGSDDIQPAKWVICDVHQLSVEPNGRQSMDSCRVRFFVAFITRVPAKSPPLTTPIFPPIAETAFLGPSSPKLIEWQVAINSSAKLNGAIPRAPNTFMGHSTPIWRLIYGHQSAHWPLTTQTFITSFS